MLGWAAMLHYASSYLHVVAIEIKSVTIYKSNYILFESTKIFDISTFACIAPSKLFIKHYGLSSMSLVSSLVSREASF